MKKIHIAASPLTGTIFAGTVLKDGRTWGAGKQDVTIEALVAVAEHALKFGKPIEIIKADGALAYRISVEARTSVIKCEWEYDGLEDYWSTACGHKHVFIDGGPWSNTYKFCPYCGKEIQQLERH